jgi:hypothetical protein
MEPAIISDLTELIGITAGFCEISPYTPFGMILIDAPGICKTIIWSEQAEVQV